jgi:hypothetical protein
MSPAEIELLLELVQAAIAAGEEMYDAAKLKQLADLEVKLQAQLSTTAQDRLSATGDIAAREQAFEDELAKAQK